MKIMAQYEKYGVIMAALNNNNININGINGSAMKIIM
jgi:hypothetical protein